MIFLMYECEERIGYTFKDKTLLRTCFTHSSYSHEHGGKNNERLEFFGDSILGFITTEYLYGKYPDLGEGQLTVYKQQLVSRKPLATAIRKLGLNDYILYGVGEKNNTPEHHEAACENLYEALVAGIYSDGGLAEAANFIKRTLLTGFRPSKSLKDANFDTLGAADKSGKDGKNGKAEADKNGGDKTPVSNFKGKLQEYVQKNKLGEIVYKEKSKSGPQHSPTFVVAVFVGGEEKGEGSGKKKSEAEQAAARVAISKFTEKSGKKPDGNNKDKNRDGKAKSRSGSNAKAPKTGNKRNGNKPERKKGSQPEKNNRGKKKTPQSD